MKSSLLAIISISPDERTDGSDGDDSDGAVSCPVAATPTVALAWDAPEQPDAGHFFVGVGSLATERPREVMARYVDVSAILVQLPPEPDVYDWRVQTVGLAPPRYVAAPWRRFTLAPPQ